MSTVLEGAVPPPHLQLATTSPWPPYSSHCYPPSSPAPMTPDSLHSYVPRLHDSPLPSQDPAAVAAPAWFPTSAPGDASNEGAYASYNYNASYGASHASSGPYSAHLHMSQAGQAAPVSAPLNIQQSAGHFSPVSNSSPNSEVPQPDFLHHSEAPSPAPSTAHPSIEAAPARPRSTPVAYPWAMNPLGISNGAVPSHYYPSPSYHSMRERSPRLSEPAMELHSDLAAPQPRRMYAPIAPHPASARTSAPKRHRDDEDDHSEIIKRRKRSDSNTSAAMDLGEEDRLLIQLKDEEAMPWKDIAARFQSDLGKTYQIPALQMRLKRLRERMRVWTEVDVKALRMAHEYWVQSKFDIIAQKMLEFGAAEKWTARQCARKWAEVDPGPTPYTTYENHVYPPYSMSPVEAHHFMPYVHIQ